MRPLKRIWNLAACAAIFFAFGCAVPQRPPKEIKTYLLSPVPGDLASALEPSRCFSVRPCRAAPAFAEKMFVYRTGESEYTTDYYHQFLMTPAENIRQALTDWITAAGWTLCTPETEAKDAYKIIPFLDEMYGDFREPNRSFAVIRMRLSLSITDPSCNCVNTLVNKPYFCRIGMTNATVRELIKAYSKGLEQIFADFQKDAEEALRGW